MFQNKRLWQLSQAADDRNILLIIKCIQNQVQLLAMTFVLQGAVLCIKIWNLISGHSFSYNLYLDYGRIDE